MNLECRQNCKHEQYGRCRIRALGRQRETICSPCPYFESKRPL